MSMEDRIPDLSDKELETLHSNAARLALSGTPAQQTQAARLLPLIDAALEQRLDIRTKELAERKRISKRVPAKRVAAKRVPDGAGGAKPA